MATPAPLSLLHHNGSTFNIPPFDYTAFTYVAAGAADDDDVATQKFYVGGAAGILVATLTFTYVGSTNNIATITLSV